MDLPATILGFCLRDAMAREQGGSAFARRIRHPLGAILALGVEITRDPDLDKMLQLIAQQLR